MSNEVLEKIVLKPPIDLIPDEYEIKEGIAVHTFTTSNTEYEEVKLFMKTLKGDGYKENMHCLDNENFKDLIKNINSKAGDSSGLILFFSYYCKEDGMINIFDGENIKSIPIQDIIMEFTAYTCPGLKNKPKIFIFHVKLLSTLQTDSRQFGSTYDVTYDTPGEADILIVYKKSESKGALDFIQKLCKNINDYGEVEDIVSLVTCVESARNDSRPLVVSTLTRKLFLFPGEHRSHYFHINQHQEEIAKHLDDIKSNLSRVKTTGKAKNSAKGRVGGVGTAKQKGTGKTASTPSSSNVPRSTTESDSGGDGTNIGSRSQLASATTSDGDAVTRRSRNRLTSKSNANLTDKNDPDTRPPWKY
ncbi:uncharacterized protein LOC108908189 [Anoplophora glabripennis]|uniref:uncharacterized protein LOC108908189 n=1 Tax=Anoplophora glabripennis TaxID=217634 RepID=UPI000873C495|nr:uncharacterized protein LOC108908189 [Anoplophora glabripennis]